MAKTTLSYTFGYQWSQEKEVEPESNIQRLAMEPKDPLDHDADAESDLSVEDMKKKRFSVCYFFGEMSTALASVLSWAFTHMKGLAGLNAWRWINICEGSLTILIGIASYLLIVTTPDADAREDWRFLTNHQKAWVRARINADRGDAKERKPTIRDYGQALKGVEIWATSSLFIFINMAGHVSDIQP
ncbi:hypothetical protein SLS57_000752 [Botryosphaeria dothidea]